KKKRRQAVRWRGCTLGVPSLSPNSTKARASSPPGEVHTKMWSSSMGTVTKFSQYSLVFRLQNSKKQDLAKEKLIFPSGKFNLGNGKQNLIRRMARAQFHLAPRF